MWQQILFVLLAMAFGWIFPIFQKFVGGVQLTENEKLGFVVVLIVIIAIVISAHKLDKVESERKAKELARELAKELKNLSTTIK